ncbi:MAG: hypothetical protein JJU02_14955 [Cryomorphaceae bacterium]|nr:hypothetical protein [Cryomorphaceae bacterium]
MKNATFNIRFFTVNADSLPSKVINSENIIGTAPKGRKIIEIDLSNHRIRLPENGIFIGFEFLIIESNKHEFVYTIKGSKKKHKGISYEPAFGLVDSETSMVFTFVNGKWRKRNIKNSLAPAIQILLVN